MTATLQQQIDFPDRDFQEISRVVYDHCGINLTLEKKELVRARLSKMLRRHGHASYRDYLKHVLENPASPDFTEFIDRLSTNLTHFFRGRDHFDYLQETHLPRLLNGAPDPSRLHLRGWCAACSSGEEPYSLAMTLSEALPMIHKADVKILASDISMTMLSRAKEGTYPKERLAAVPWAYQKKYFKAQKENLRSLTAKEELKKLLLFKQINLMDEWPLRIQLDFIFCRNVLIYFDRPTQQRLIKRFHQVLKPGGGLFIGHSESLSGIDHEFESVGPSIYLKRATA